MSEPQRVQYNHYKHISAEHHLLDLKLGELWKYRDLVILFVKRAFTVSYKQTVLGPAWLIINPLLTSIMHLIVFGNIAKLGTDGVPQILFYFVGTAIWGLFANCLNHNATVFVSNARVFGKVYFPRLAVPVSSAIGNIIRLGIQMVLIVVLIVFFAVQGMVSVNWPFLWLVPVIVVQLALFGMAIGLFASSLTTKYRDLSVLVGFGVQLWMYATPVVYPLSQLGDGLLRDLILLNPLTAPMELFRFGLFGCGSAMWDAWGISLLITVVALVLSIILFNRVERNFMDTV